MKCKDFHHLPRPAAGQPLKSAEPSILVITQTTSRKAVAIRRNILTPRGSPFYELDVASDENSRGKIQNVVGSSKAEYFDRTG
jgi:hypothetical protein